MPTVYKKQTAKLLARLRGCAGLPEALLFAYVRRPIFSRRGSYIIIIAPKHGYCFTVKYEEIYPPDVGEFVYITDDTYTKQQVLRMEHLILKVLTFDVAVPTTNWFCENFIKACDASTKLKSMTMVSSTLQCLWPVLLVSHPLVVGL